VQHADAECRAVQWHAAVAEPGDELFEHVPAGGQGRRIGQQPVLSSDICVT